MLHLKRSFTLAGPKVVASIVGEFVRSIDCVMLYRATLTMQLATKLHMILAGGIVEMVLDPYAFW